MLFQERFSTEEQVSLAALPSLAAAAMVLAEGSGLGTITEIIAAGKSKKEGLDYYAENEILAALKPVLTRNPESDTDNKLRDELKAYLKNQRKKGKAAIKESALEMAKSVNKLLIRKATPLEADQYKNFILDISEDVSTAAKEGGFLGLGGELVSDGEKNFFTELAAALHPVKKIARD